MFSGMGIPGGCIGQDKSKRYTPALFGGYHEVPAGMTEVEFWDEADNQIKEASYNRAVCAGRVIGTYVSSQEQMAHPLENQAYLQYDSAPAQDMRHEVWGLDR